MSGVHSFSVVEIMAPSREVHDNLSAEQANELYENHLPRVAREGGALYLQYTDRKGAVHQISSFEGERFHDAEDEFEALTGEGL